MKAKSTFPTHGRPHDAILQDLRSFKSGDLDWHRGRSFSYVYHAEDSIVDLLKEAYTTYFSENALNPAAFPSLRRMEVEVIQMCLDLLGAGPDGRGSLTSGGTESIMMAIKSARDYAQAQRPDLARPQIILPISAHPAFQKACHYFGLEATTVPLCDDFRVDVTAMRAAITDRTILLVASAPQYPQGVVDPVRAVGELAMEHGLLCHVDACVGGFVLPFMAEAQRLAFDLSVPGVTSLSADIHKYGYAAKGCSVILYNRPELRKAQYYVYTQWPGGMYGSPSVAGTRPGGAIAMAWAVLQHLGRSGYERLVAQKMTIVQRLREAIAAMPELYVVGEPDMCIFSIASDSMNIYELGDELYVRGWLLDRQQMPASLHLSISPNHADYVDEFLADLKACVAKVKSGSVASLGNRAQVAAAKGLRKVLPKKTFDKLQSKIIENANPDDKRSAALYGMIGDLQGSGELDVLIKDYLDKMMR